MSADKVFGGGCLCGAVRFELTQPPPPVWFCHCKMCRRWSGGLPLAAVEASPPRLLRAEALRWHASSDFGERGFCEKCGSKLFWRESAAAAEWDITAAALDDESALQMGGHIYYDDKPGYYSFADAACKHSGAEHLANSLRKSAAAGGGNAHINAMLQKYASLHPPEFIAKVRQNLAANGQD